MPGGDLPGAEGKTGENLQAEQVLEGIWRAHHTSCRMRNSYKNLTLFRFCCNVNEERKFGRLMSLSVWAGSMQVLALKFQKKKLSEVRAGPLGVGSGFCNPLSFPVLTMQSVLAALAAATGVTPFQQQDW